jgi:hypothetical protein
VNASVVAAVFISNSQIDTSWTPKIRQTYPGCWTVTSTPGKLWVGGNFSGERTEQPQAVPRGLPGQLRGRFRPGTGEAA